MSASASSGMTIATVTCWSGASSHVAERHEEQRVGEREEQRARDIRAEQRHDRALQHQRQPELPREIGARRLAEQPAGAARCDQQQAGRPGGGREPRQLRPALPHQPGDDRSDEQAMADRSSPVHQMSDEPRDIGAEQQQDRGRDQGQCREMEAPGRHCRRSRNRDGHAARAVSSPSKASSGASRASQA